MKVAAIILAAGASSRMGQSKQRLPWKAGTLLTNAIEVISSEVYSTTVVLGADENQNRELVAGKSVNAIFNPDWERGMGSSLKAGLTHVIQSNPETDAIVVMVCDQPFVTTTHLKELINCLGKPGIKAAFSYYAGTAGVPAVFLKALFKNIQQLADDQGAKKIIPQLKKEELATVELKGGEIDLDTYEQYLKYKQSK